MTFPIAVGTGPRHTSSRPFPHANSRGLAHNRESDGGEINEQAAIMAMGTNVDETLTATMFISYHFIASTPDAVDSVSKTVNCDDIGGREKCDGAVSENYLPSNNEMGMINDHVTADLLNVECADAEFRVIAELRVEITPTTSPFVSNMDAMSSRETKSRVPLGTMRKRRTPMNSCETYLPNASIEFASNNTHLACLIPLPIDHELVLSCDYDHGAEILPSRDKKYALISTMVIFQIQTSVISNQQHLQQGKNLHLPALPDYIVESGIGGGITENGLENEMVDNVDMSEMSFQQTFPGSTNVVSSSMGGTMSYVAHRPKIVRALRSSFELGPDLGKIDVAIPNRSFVRKLSRGSSNSDSILSPTLKSATCMCNVPSDHFRGRSSSASSLLLVGTIDGGLLIVDFSSARVCSVAFEAATGNTVEECDIRKPHYQKIMSEKHNHKNEVARRFGYSCNPIIFVSQIPPTQWKSLDIYGNEQGSQSKGRVSTVLRDGSVTIYTTSFVIPSVIHVDSLSEDRLQNGIDRSNSSDRFRGESDNLMSRTRLEMRLHLLATYHASELDRDVSVSRLRYIRAKWISPVVLSLLTRSSYLDNDFLLGQSLSKSVMQSEIEVAQVWCIAEVNKEDSIWPDVGWEVSAAASIVLASELKVPCGDSLNDLVHDTFSLSRATSVSPDVSRSKDARLNVGKMHIFAECSRGMSLLYHRVTDCFAITSQVVTCSSSSAGVALSVRPFCLIWDWKRNVPGLTLASCESYRLSQHDDDTNTDNMHSLYSWFQLGDDPYNGLCALHVHEYTLCGKIRRAVKKIFSLGTLSPQNRCSTEGYLSVNETSAVLLNSDSVTYPVLGKPTSTLDVSLKWEESRVPSTYIASNGPCKIAAVGKDYGRSIAVAASRGLCVMILSRIPTVDTGRPSSASQSPRWKLFSNINDEHRFRVVGMNWWECESNDFLLAVVQYATGGLRLVCWSRNSIGFGGSQLLTESATNDEYGNDVASPCGVALPLGFRVHSMSIIRDPISSPPGARSTSSNRALLLLAYVSSDEGAGCSMNYALYQLQTIPHQKKTELVLARKAAHGSIPLQIGTSPDFSAAESVNGIFLAGGSFLFDLEKELGDQAQQAPYDAVGVIGIITLFQGLVAVVVNQTETILYRPSLLGDAKGRNMTVSYWMSCTISSRYGSRIAWNIIQNDGSVYCWSVPCKNSECLHVMGLDEHYSDNLLGLEKHSVLGEICCLGSSTFWMNGASTSEREIAIGPFSSLFHASTLYAGQRSSTANSFHVTNIIVAPPPFTSFLFVSFLILSSRSSSCGSNPDRTSKSNHELAIESIKSTIRQQLHGRGSTSSALRLITLKVVELLEESKSVSNICVASKIPDLIGKDKLFLLQKWRLGKAVLSEIVTAVNEFYDALGFATFFLSVGRQLEPHQFDLIFPLPAISLAPSSPYLHTAEDLFLLSCECGSLATALSALPLFKSHEESVHMVNKLIYHCLIKIEENYQLCSTHTAITSYEDESHLHQLFWFGVKLEDAIEIEKSNEVGMEEYGSSREYESLEEEHPFDSNQSSVDSSSTSDDDSYSSESNHNVSFLSPCRSPNRKSRSGIVKRVVQRLFPSSGSTVIPDSRNEYTMKEVASSTMLTGFNDTPIDSFPAPQHNRHVTPVTKPIDDKSSSGKEDSHYDVFPSVAGSVCLFIGRTVFDGRDNKAGLNFGWKALSAVAHLLQGDRESADITSASMENAKRISQISTMKDFLLFVPASSIKKCSMEKKDLPSVIAGMLVELTYNCRREIHMPVVGTVFNLILLLLLRYDACHDVRLSRANLITIGIISGHLSGRICELLDFSEICDVNDIYSVYAGLEPLEALAHSVCM